MLEKQSWSASLLGLIPVTLPIHLNQRPPARSVYHVRWPTAGSALLHGRVSRWRLASSQRYPEMKLP